MLRIKNKKVAILGWGINGRDVLNYLQGKKAKITILDRKEEGLDFSGVNLKDLELKLGEDYLRNGLVEYDFVFRTPGVYRFLPEIVEAEKKGVVITSAVSLFFDECPAKIIGVTGTKGKGTTSTLIYEILKKDGKDVYLAGNIGIPLLEILPKLKNTSWVVLELSSFQLIDMNKSPHIAVVLNITEDHLDWHKNRKEYVEAKSQIVRHQRKDDYAILAFDYNDSRKFASLTKGAVYYFSRSKRVKGGYVKDGKIFLEDKGKRFEIGDVKNLLLRGKHNWENVCAAVSASYLAGASLDSIKQTVFSFKGLEHRLELVGEFRGIKFYNDSFSTNPQTTIAAIYSFEEPITLILGGSDKGLSYDALGEEIARKPNVRNIILIGETSEKIKNSVVKAGYKGRIIELGKRDMRSIVSESFEVTPKKGVVLLSPASASFDMFKDYKDRGEQFKKEVSRLVSN